MKLNFDLKVRPRTDKPKADGTFPLNYFVTIGRITTKLPTGRSIDLKDWDKNRRLPKRNNKVNIALGDFFTRQRQTLLLT